ncbi:hypothetical protein FOXYSP1_08649 [Fusarium oxysporum f. sp. phaseoli]
MQEVRAFANQLGWTGEPLQGPSSMWLDPAVHAEWLGHGARDDKLIYESLEKQQRWSILRRTVGLKETPRRLLKRRNSIS